MRQHTLSVSGLPFSASRLLPFALGFSLMAGVLLGGCASHSNAHSATGGAFATPTPAFASHGPLARVVAPAVWATGVVSLDTSYDQTRGSALVTITLGGTVPNTDAKTSAAQDLAKSLCFMAEQALWTSGSSFDEVKVIVQGPFQDEYGGTVTDAYALVVVEAKTARTIPWTTATADSAWPSYDSAFLRESFVLVD